MKTSSSAFVLGLFFVLSAVFAGGQNCSHGTMNGGAISGYMPCNAEQGHIWTYNQTKSFVDTCTNTQTGVAYDGIPSSITSAGQCLYEAELLDCPVFFSNNETDGTGPGDYNRFYNRAYPQTIGMSNGYQVCLKGVMAQDFEQCSCAACTCTNNPSFVCATGTGDGGSASPTCTDGQWTCNGATECQLPPSQYTCGEGEVGTPSCDSSGWYCWENPSTPIIIDTTGTGFHLTDFEDGVFFDLAGDGKKEKLSWIARGSTNGWLALPNNDGKVTTGKELFGNFTPQPKSDHPNGFLALAVYDLPERGGNGDGVIDWHDAVWSKLRIWIDKNHDGIAQPEELFTLPSLGVNSLSLAYVESKYTDQYGNQFHYKGNVNPDGAALTDHVDKTMYDVFLLTTANQNNKPSATKAKIKPHIADNDMGADHQLR